MLVEMSAGGLSQRAIERAWAKARGQVVGSQSAGSDIPERLPHAYAAVRPRDRSGFALASLCMDTGDAPLRRWGSQPGGRCVGGLCVDGRTVLLPLSPTNRASDERCLEGWRARSNRGLQPPVTRPTDGAPGLRPAVDRMWPRSLRRRGGFHTRPPLPQQVPPQAWPAGNACIAARRDVPTFAAGQRRQQALLAHERDTLPEAGRCLADAAAARRHHLKVSARHRQEVRTSNLAARACAEERRRTQVRPPRWDEAS
jgi:transposase-like protein